MTTRPQALRLAEAIDPLIRYTLDNLTCSAAAAELRRLHEENASLRREAAAQRQWVGLTDEERLHLVDTHVGGVCPSYPLGNDDWINYASAIEAKLKEKNNG